MSEYDVIVVDPPWAYGSAQTGGKPGAAEGQYRTIGNSGREVNRRTGAGTEAIAASAPVGEWAAQSSALFLWTTNPKLPFAFDVVARWGFDYKTTLTWVKTTQAGGVLGGGLGWFFRGATEHVLFGTRGGFAIPAAVREPNVVMATRSRHSAKPDEFYALLDRLFPGARKIDVFARRQRDGWDVWGDEVNDATTPAAPSLHLQEEE
jgi:N6-adenosine-specific RNA methylase IME4